MIEVGEQGNLSLLGNLSVAGTLDLNNGGTINLANNATATQKPETRKRATEDTTQQTIDKAGPPAREGKQDRAMAECRNHVRA